VLGGTLAEVLNSRKDLKVVEHLGYRTVQRKGIAEDKIYEELCRALPEGHRADARVALRKNSIVSSRKKKKSLRSSIEPLPRGHRASAQRAGENSYLSSGRRQNHCGIL